MSVAIVLLVALFVVYVVSLFGSALPSSRALLWLGFLLALLIAAISPELLRPIAQTLHVEYVSNLVLAGAVVFLVLQILTDARAQYQTQNQVRLLGCTVAAERARTLGAPGNALGVQESVLIVLPCYNEEASLPTLLPALQKLHEAHPYIGFCVVDDCSRDRTPELLSALPQGRAARHPYNLGVSGVLLTGFILGLERKATWFVQCDADGQHPVEEIPRMIEHAEREQLDLLVGSRFADGRESLHSTTMLRRLGSLLLVGTLRTLFPHVRLSDPTSGFRVYSAKAANTFLRNMPERYPEPEMLAIAATHGLRVSEVQVGMKPRETGVSSIIGFGAPAYMFRVMVALLGHRLRSATSGQG